MSAAVASVVITQLIIVLSITKTVPFPFVFAKLFLFKSKSNNEVVFKRLAIVVHVVEQRLIELVSRIAWKLSLVSKRVPVSLNLKQTKSKQT